MNSRQTAPLPPLRPPRVLIVANWDWVLYNFRLPLARSLESAGLEVLLLCPRGDYIRAIRDSGFQLVDWGLDRKSKNPFKELGAIFQLLRLYRQLAPDVVHHFTIKPIVYGSLAAKLAGIPKVINNFTGLGYLFSPDWRARILRFLVLPLLALLTRFKNIATVFQNENDYVRLRRSGVNPSSGKLVIPGTGVDLQKFRPHPEKVQAPLVLMAARLLYDKGVREFVEAADQVLGRGTAAQFWIAGRPDPANPSSIPEHVLHEWAAHGTVNFLGHRTDIAELLAQATVAVLPSYHEGIPLFLLEAAASGLPLVGSDIEGCRMVIEEGANGFLAPAGDSATLAAAIHKILSDPELQTRLGSKSRKIAEGRFGQEIILEQYRRLYQQLGIIGLGN